jgi:erythromycin esterase-like protein
MPAHHTVDDWIAKDAIRFTVDSPPSIDAGVDRVMASLGDSVELLALGEALHGSEEILLVRNRLFQRLVEAHGYGAVVIEASSPRARAINDYVLGLRDGDDQSVRDWFGAGFGALHANQELVEWMRRYNSDPTQPVKLHFYGFDLPLGQGGLASPSPVLDIVFDYLGKIDGASAKAHRDRAAPLIGEEADWERAAAMFDPAQSIGLTPAATELRIATQDLITELCIRRPELTARSDTLSYADALHHAELAGKLLNAHAALAKPGAYAVMLGIRDLIMADNLEHFVAQERGRGKVLAFAASGHLKRSTVQWTLPPGEEVKEWWPAGSHVTQRFGSRYAVIGQALGVSEENAIGVPEEGSLEARLTREGGAMFIPTHRGEGLQAGEVAGLPIRSGSTLNPTYAMLTPVSFTDFEWLVVFDSTAYPRGAPSLAAWNA